MARLYISIRQDATRAIHLRYVTFSSSYQLSDVIGMPHDELKDDPQLGNKRNELITQSARHLATARMARYDEHTNAFVISDLGRIAAKYYLKHQTIDVFSTSPLPLRTSRRGS